MPPLDKISESRLEPLYPEFAAMIRILAGRLDFPVRVTQGLRTWEEQDALYAQIPPVTKARGGWSWHNFGLAVDLVPMTDTGPDWNVNHPAWREMVTVGVEIGLTMGALFRTFPDRPHAQLTGRFPPTPTDEVRNLYKTGGMEMVWREAFKINEGVSPA